MVQTKKLDISDDSDDIRNMKMGAPGDLVATFAAGNIQAQTKTENNEDKIKIIL
jgi:hypothetical protein